jgi:hypothetical protein
MKKKCSTNAISISTPIVNCAPVVPVVPATCTDPLTYFLNTAVALSIERNDTLDAVTTQLLNFGMILPSGTSICCPDCVNAPFYALTNYESFYDLSTTLNWSSAQPNLLNMCCLNIDLTIDHYGKFTEVMSNKPLPPCCNNNFTECLKTYSSNVDYFVLLGTGIIEVNTLNGASALCKLFSFLESLPNSVSFATNITNYISTLLTLGFVTHCCGCNIMIGSVSTFDDYTNSGGCPIFNIAEL